MQEGKFELILEAVVEILKCILRAGEVLSRGVPR